MRLGTNLKPPVLFVPGAMSGEWIWKDNFARYFAEAGFPVSTMQFRGHGASASQRLRMRFNDYVDDCVTAIASCETPPLVVGHSLGGLVSLHAATKAKVNAMALLSPVPVQGMLGSVASLALRSPVSVAKFGIAVIEARATRLGAPPVGIYSESCDPKRTEAITRQLKSEALPVIFRLLAPPRLQLARLTTERILCVGATGDHIIPPKEVERSARHIGAQYRCYDGLSHTFQAESGWEAIARNLIDFFENQAYPLSRRP